MNLRKLIVLWTLSLAGVSHAAPASLTVSVPNELFAGMPSIATVTVNTGSGVFGAADVLITYDPAVVTVSQVGLADSPFQGTTYINSSVMGRVRILALNGTSVTSPAGSVDVATVMFIPTQPGAAILDAQVNLILDTEPLAYTPVTVQPGNFTILPDSFPPRTTLTVGTPQMGADPLIISSTTLLSLSAVDDGGILGDLSGIGVKETQIAIDSEPFSLYSEPITLTTEGTHTLQFFSRDHLLNTEAVGSTVVAVDVTPPVSSLQAGTTTYTLSGEIVLTPTTPVRMVSVDALAGVATRYFAFDGEAFQELTGDFLSLPFASGTHTVAIYSMDRLGHAETPKTFTLQFPSDVTAPVTSIAGTAPSYIGPDGTLFIAKNSRVSLSAVDPSSGGTASGVVFTKYSVDNAAFQNYVTPITLAVGIHAIQAYSEDALGNRESLKTFAVRVDAAPPVSTLAAGEPKLNLLGILLIAPQTALSINAIDPVNQGVSSGVQDSWVSIDAEPFRRVDGNVFIPATRSSLHIVRYYSRDKVLNTESVRLAIVIVVASSHRAPGTGATLSLDLPPAAPEFAAGESAVLYQNAVRILHDLETGAMSSPFFGAPDLSPNLLLREMFVFPNPARAGAKPTIHVEVGIADQVILTIYDAAGRRVHETTLTQTPTLIDSGNGDRYAYEYLWDGDIPSGIYFYSIEAKKAGESTVHAKGKFAVVR